MNINEEIKRMKVLMGLNENIQNNNFADMGIDKKSISRGGVMYQEQDIVAGVDLSKPYEPEKEIKSDFEQEVEDRKDDIEQEVMDYRKEVSDKKEDAEDDEQKRQEEVKKQEEERREAEEKKKEKEEEEKKEKELAKKEEEERKKEELEARLGAQRERTT